MHKSTVKLRLKIFTGKVSWLFAFLDHSWLVNTKQQIRIEKGKNKKKKKKEKKKKKKKMELYFYEFI